MRSRAALSLALLTFLLVTLVGKVERLGGWDETFYLTQLSSVVEDGDLDLRNDVLWATLPPTELRRLLITTLPNGSLANHFSIGPALYFAPVYLLTLPARLLADVSSARWSWVQLVGLHLFSLGLVFWLLWWLRCWLRRLGLAAGSALLGTAALVLGTPILIYGFWHYAGSHLLSAVAACAFVGATVRLERRRDLPSALVAGAFLGLVSLVRWQDLLMAVALLIPALRLRRERTPLPRVVALAGALIASFAGVASVQLHAWASERGEFLTMPQGSGFVDLARPELVKFLFSGFCGLLPWSPLVAACFLGLVLPWRLRLPRSWALVALVLLAAEIYVNACVADWWGGSAYGARRMTSTLPFLALGLANFLRQRWMVATPGVATPGSAGWRRVVPSALLVLVCLWGTVTAQLYRRNVHDLGLVFLGRASAGALESEVGESDPAAARRALGFPLNFRLPDYLDAEGPRALLGRLLGAGLIATVLTVAARAASRGRPRRRPQHSPSRPLQVPAVDGQRAAAGRAAAGRAAASRAAAWRRDRALLAAGAVLALAAGFHVRLGTGTKTDATERALWRAFASTAASPAPEYALLDRSMRRFEQAEQAEEAEAAGEAGEAGAGGSGRGAGGTTRLALPGVAEEAGAGGSGRGAAGTTRLALPGVADSEIRLRLRGDPYRYLYLWSLWQRNRAGKAGAQLDELAARGYPAAKALVALGQDAGAGGTIRLALPGMLLGRGDSELRLRLRGERALFVKRLVITADVTVLDPPGGERPVVALLAGPTVIARLDLFDGDSVVSTPTIELRVPAGWAGRQTLRFTWDGPNEEATIERGRGARYGQPVTAPGAAAKDYSVDDLALAFAPATGRDGQPGLAVANLFVATAPR